jgi:hypothetical protein
MVGGESIYRCSKTFLPLFLPLIFDLSSPFLTTMALMPAALKNDDGGRGLLLEALTAYGLSMGIISCQNTVSKSTPSSMPTLDTLLVATSVSQIAHRWQSRNSIYSAYGNTAFHSI